MGVKIINVWSVHWKVAAEAGVKTMNRHYLAVQKAKETEDSLKYACTSRI